MRKILILEANSIQAQPIAKCLKRSGYYTIAFCEEKYSYGYYSKYFDEKYLTVSCARNEEEYYRKIIGYLRKKTVDVIIPMSDDSAFFLAKHQDVLREYASFSMPSFDNFMRGYDKNRLMSVCRRLGVDHPLTIDLSQEYDLSRMKFPAIIKPNITTGGRGMRVVNDEAALIKVIPPTVLHYGECHVQEFVPPGGRQIKVQLLVDKDCRLLIYSVMCKKRMYPVNGGSSCCNITIEEPSLVNNCLRILKAINWRGFADFDVIEDPRNGALKIMEINPRIPACIKGSVIAGVDWGNAIVCEALGITVPEYKNRLGFILRYLGFEILWFLRSRERFSAKPSWFLFFGKKVFYQDLDLKDFKSFIMGTYGNLLKLTSPKFRAAKDGMNHLGG